MKLELHHLAPYLPYGLKIKILNYKCDYVGIEFAIVTGFYMIGIDLYVTYEGGSTGKGIDDFKPMLKPLSTLKYDAFHISTLEESIANGNIPLGAFNGLCAGFFDVSNLIPAGLAIPL